MKLVLTVVLYVTLAAVVLSCGQSVWLALAEPERYAAAFPAATGSLYLLTIMASAVAALNAIAIALRLRWAIWTNIVVGICSIILVELSKGSPTTVVVIAVSCAISTLLPLLLWKDGEEALG